VAKKRAPGATSKKLEYLPLISNALRRLQVRETIDELVQADPRQVVTTGQCVEALVVAILTGTHTLYRVDQQLTGYDLELGLGWVTPASRFHDQRLARGLDDFVETGINVCTSAIFMRALAEYTIDLAVLRLDTTSASVHGTYKESAPPADPEDVNAIPYVTKGRSKDRHGLKQIVFGTAVTEEGVPVFGRAASGNRSDSNELRFLMRRVAERVPDPAKTTIVGDSKLCAGETLELARKLGLRFVTLLPKSTNARAEALRGFHEARRQGEVEVFMEKMGRTGEVETWRGCSVPVIFDYDDPEKKAVVRSLRRTIVVESSGLRRQKQGALEKGREREREDLERVAKSQRRKIYRCLDDAEEAAARLRARTPRFHKLAVKIGMEDVPRRRARAGRPKAGERRETETVFRAWFEVLYDQKRFDEILVEESCYVLVTNHLAVGESARSNREIFDLYHGQWGVERVMHWFKGALDFAPIFIKTPARIAAITQVYVIALMVYALIEREARFNLATAKTTIPGDLKPTSKPTTQVAFRLFEKVMVARGPRDRAPVIENLTTAQVLGYEALGVHILARPGVRFGRPRRPQPGDRGYYHPRTHRHRRRTRPSRPPVGPSR
jgi:transposase